MRQSNHRRISSLARATRGTKCEVIELLEPRRLLSAITSGQRITANITTPTQVDTYTFTANVGDSVTLLVADTSGNGSSLDFAPYIELDKPDTTVLDSAADYIGSTLQDLNLATGGTYTVKINDNAKTHTGSYALSFVKTPATQLVDSDSGPITSGQFKTGTSDYGDLDVYTFTATAGSSIEMVLADSSGNGSSLDYLPVLDIFRPDGSLLGTSNDYIGSSQTDFNLVQGGTYTAVVRDASADHAGAYALSLFVAPSTQATDADSHSISSGQFVTGTTDLGDLDVFTITANSGDSLEMVLADTTGNGSSLDYLPQMDVYAPNGAHLGENDDYVGSSITLQSVTQSGTYSIVVRDASSDHAGAYALSVAKSPAVQLVDADSGPILSGQRKTGIIGYGDLDVYTFSANAGDTIELVLADTTGNGSSTDFLPEMDLYQPGGGRLGENDDYVGSSLTFTSLAQGGTYTLVVRDSSSDRIGGYALSLARAPSAQVVDSDSLPIVSSQRRTGTIDYGDLDIYTFTANIGDSIELTFADTSGNGSSNDFTPYVDLYQPNGARLGAIADYVGATLAFQNLAQGGKYYAVLRDDSSDRTGSYAISLARFGTGASSPLVSDQDSTTLVSGQHLNGQLDYGDLDVESFSLNAGDSFVLTTGATGGATDRPHVDVYNSAGALLQNTEAGLGAYAVVNSVASTGTYYAVIRDSTADNAGSYDLSFARFPAAPIADSLDGNDGGALVAGTTQFGSYTPGDSDIYTFAGTSGTPVTIKLNDLLTNSFSPYVAVYGPTGTFIGDASSALNTTESFTPSTTGTFYALVVDQNITNAGSYGIVLNGTVGADTRAPTMVQGHFDGGNGTSAQKLSFSFSESIGNTGTFDDLTLQNLTAGTTIDNSNFTVTYNTSNNRLTYTFPLLTNGVLPDGSYRATIAAGSVSDAAGNGLAANAVFNFIWVNDSTGTDAFKIQRSGSQTQVIRNSTTFSATTSTLGAIAVAGGIGDDTFTIDLANGNPIPTTLGASTFGGLAIDGGAGTNALTVLGTSAADSALFEDGAVVLGTNTATFNSILTLNFDGKLGNDILTDNGAAVLNLPASQTLASLTVGSDSVVSLAPSGTKILIAQSITFSPFGTLDLNDNDMILDYSAATQLPAVQTLLNSSRNGGNWDGVGGITSSSAKNDALHNTTLGAMESSDYKTISALTQTFDGQAIDNSAVVIKYTYYGDANFNGKVDGGDYSRTDQTFNAEIGNENIGGWINGDFDGNGKVDGGDYALIDHAFNNQGSAIRPPAGALLPPVKPSSGASVNSNLPDQLR